MSYHMIPGCELQEIAHLHMFTGVKLWEKAHFLARLHMFTGVRYGRQLIQTFPRVSYKRCMSYHMIAERYL